jgi:hypothetical protein
MPRPEKQYPVSYCTDICCKMLQYNYHGRGQFIMPQIDRVLNSFSAGCRYIQEDETAAADAALQAGYIDAHELQPSAPPAPMSILAEAESPLAMGDDISADVLVINSRVPSPDEQAAIAEAAEVAELSGLRDDEHEEDLVVLPTPEAIQEESEQALGYAAAGIENLLEGEAEAVDAVSTGDWLPSYTTGADSLPYISAVAEPKLYIPSLDNLPDTSTQAMVSNSMTGTEALPDSSEAELEGARLGVRVSGSISASAAELAQQLGVAQVEGVLPAAAWLSGSYPPAAAPGADQIEGEVQGSLLLPAGTASLSVFDLATAASPQEELAAVIVDQKHTNEGVSGDTPQEETRERDWNTNEAMGMLKVEEPVPEGVTALASKPNQGPTQASAAHYMTPASDSADIAAVSGPTLSTPDATQGAYAAAEQPLADEKRQGSAARGMSEDGASLASGSQSTGQKLLDVLSGSSLADVPLDAILATVNDGFRAGKAIADARNYSTDKEPMLTPIDSHFQYNGLDDSDSAAMKDEGLFTAAIQGEGFVVHVTASRSDNGLTETPQAAANAVELPPSMGQEVHVEEHGEDFCSPQISNANPSLRAVAAIGDEAVTDIPDDVVSSVVVEQGNFNEQGVKDESAARPEEHGRQQEMTMADGYFTLAAIDSVYNNPAEESLAVTAVAEEEQDMPFIGDTPFTAAAAPVSSLKDHFSGAETEQEDMAEESLEVAVYKNWQHESSDALAAVHDEAMPVSQDPDVPASEGAAHGDQHHVTAGSDLPAQVELQVEQEVQQVRGTPLPGDGATQDTEITHGSPTLAATELEDSVLVNADDVTKQNLRVPDSQGDFISGDQNKQEDHSAKESTNGDVMEISNGAAELAEQQADVAAAPVTAAASEEDAFGKRDATQAPDQASMYGGEVEDQKQQNSVPEIIGGSVADMGIVPAEPAALQNEDLAAALDGKQDAVDSFKVTQNLQEEALAEINVLVSLALIADYPSSHRLVIDDDQQNDIPAGAAKLEEPFASSPAGFEGVGIVVSPTPIVNVDIGQDPSIVQADPAAGQEALISDGGLDIGLETRAADKQEADSAGSITKDDVLLGVHNEEIEPLEQDSSASQYGSELHDDAVLDELAATQDDFAAADTAHGKTDPDDVSAQTAAIQDGIVTAPSRPATATSAVIEALSSEALTDVAGISMQEDAGELTEKISHFIPPFALLTAESEMGTKAVASFSPAAADTPLFECPISADDIGALEADLARLSLRWTSSAELAPDLAGLLSGPMSGLPASSVDIIAGMGAQLFTGGQSPAFVDQPCPSVVANVQHAADNKTEQAPASDELAAAVGKNEAAVHQQPDWVDVSGYIQEGADPAAGSPEVEDHSTMALTAANPDVYADADLSPVVSPGAGVETSIELGALAEERYSSLDWQTDSEDSAATNLEAVVIGNVLDGFSLASTVEAQTIIQNSKALSGSEGTANEPDHVQLPAGAVDQEVVGGS